MKAANRTTEGMPQQELDEGGERHDNGDGRAGAGAAGAADAATGAAAKARSRAIAAMTPRNPGMSAQVRPGPGSRHAVRNPLAPGPGRAPAVVAAARNGSA